MSALDDNYFRLITCDGNVIGASSSSGQLLGQPYAGSGTEVGLSDLTILT